jgi:hypothetical protein
MATKKELKGHKWVLAKLGTKLPYRKVVLLGIKGQEAHIEWRDGLYQPVDAHINIRHLKLIKKPKKR